jgi:DNA-binding FadR family transcriptional regulator
MKPVHQAKPAKIMDLQSVTPVVTLLQGYLANVPLLAGGRLPPERELAAALGLSRPEVRKALAVLEADGQLWRHHGKGTFVGARPLAAIGGIVELAQLTSPDDLLRARMAIEPQLAGLAARHAGATQHAVLRDIAQRSREPGLTWRQFEMHDATFHRGIAEAAANPVLLHLFDELSALRRAITWNRHRVRPEGPPKDHHSLADHDRIVAAIEARDADAAILAMQAHLEAVHRRLKADPTVA